MDYQDYAADASPRLSSPPSSVSPSAAAAADTVQTIQQPSYPPLTLTMNTSRTLSPTEQSNSLLPQESISFQPYHAQPSSSSSPFRSTSTDDQHITLLTTPSTTLIDAFDQDSSNNNTAPQPLDTESLPGTLQLATSTPSSSNSNVITDYWHGHATPPQSLLLRTPTLHCGDVNHSERGIAGFVSKLYQSLQAPDDGQKYARWCKHNGKDMFIIECIPKFTEVVLPRLFKHCKFASFVRQLNIYGFQRDTDARKTKDTKDKESCRWHHPYFRPGRRDLFHLIRRKATRYSRRKRVKMEQDPATIVNVGSGDESDSELMNEDDGGRSSSVSSAAVSTHPHDDFNNNTSFDQATTTTTTAAVVANNQFQLIYGCLQDQARTHSSQPVHMQETGHAAAAAGLSTATPDNYMRNVCSNQLVQTDNSNYGAPPPSNMVQENTERDGVLLAHHSPAAGAWNVATQQHHHRHHHHQQQQHQHPSLDPRIASMREQELRAQIVHLRQAYQQMTRDLTAQINGAYGMIEAQSRRIQSLEAALAKSNMGMTHPHEYMTPYVEPTSSFMQMNHHPQRQQQQQPQPTSSASTTLSHTSNLYTPHLYNDNSPPLPDNRASAQQISGVKPTSVKVENLAILSTAPSSQDWVSVYSTSNPSNASNAPSVSSPAAIVVVQTAHTADQSSSTFNSDASKYTRGMI